MQTKFCHKCYALSKQHTANGLATTTSFRSTILLGCPQSIIDCFCTHQVVNQYTHLDLLAPMPDVEVDKQRVLIVEGSLKHRDHNNTRVSPQPDSHSNCCVYMYITVTEALECVHTTVKHFRCLQLVYLALLCWSL